MLQDSAIKECCGVRAAFYARVSSDQQAAAGTIESQVAALEERVTADGVNVTQDLRFIEEGHTGSSLVRPQLERLRDLASSGAIDRLYLLCPDRLARKHSIQMVLIDELERCGVELVFLNHESKDTPEDRLMVNMQGVFAEYERTKIMERSRRGKLHAARRGTVSVLGNAPYGYRYVSAVAGAPARYDVQPEQAAVMHEVFQWIAEEHLSIAQAVKRLENKGVLSPSGRPRWDRTTLWGLLKNPAYKGQAAFGKTRMGPMRSRLRAARGCPDFPRHGQSAYDTPASEWIGIPVPAIVDEALFDAVAEQLMENRKRQRERCSGARYLLQGLLVCGCCHYAFYARGNRMRKDRRHCYAYYRCSGTESSRFGGQRRCDNNPLKQEALDKAVWDDVHSLLADPKRIEQELARRLDCDAAEPEHQADKKLQARIDAVRRGMSALIDAYQDGLLMKGELEPRLKSAREQLARLEAELKSARDRQQQSRELRGVVDNLQLFALQVSAGLDNADWETKREVIRTLVKRIEIDKTQVNVIYRVDVRPFAVGPNRGRSHYCWRRVDAAGRSVQSARRWEGQLSSPPAVLRRPFSSSSRRRAAGTIAHKSMASPTLRQQVSEINYP